MKILVAVKRVIEPYVKIRVKSDETAVETQNVKMAMNPFDEIAIEEAMRIKEGGHASEVVAVSIGIDACQETLRHALALGVDRAILVRTESNHCSLSIAKILENLVQTEKPNLVLMGKQSIDGDNNQTPQMLASLLDWPQATYASSIVFDGDRVAVTREIDGGLETLSVTLPVVISTDLRLNEPRYASLPNIMKSKSKPLEIRDLISLNLELKEHTRVLSVKTPLLRVGGVKVQSVQELVDKLRLEEKVI